MIDSGCRHLYIHIPFCSGKCSYCAFYSERYVLEAADAFLEALDAEMDLCTKAGLAARPTTVYVGGGTPSVLSRSQLRRLFACVHEHVDARGVEEWTVECNPATATREKLDLLRNHGITRVSLGAQAMTDTALAALGRGHDTLELAGAVRDSRAAGFTDIALDLIAGLPGCGQDAWIATLERTLALRPTHVSVYALSVENGTRLAAAVEAGDLLLPGEDDQLQALETAEETLSAACFERYEISNYAPAGGRCRHNMGYWQGRDYLGIGPAAASRKGRRRWTNLGDLSSYVHALSTGAAPPREEETLDAPTDAVERLAFALRLTEGIPEPRIVALPVADEWLASLRRMAQEGLVETGKGHWRLTRRGREVADSVIRELMVVA